MWDDRRSCAWLGSPSLWLGDGKQSCLNIVLSVVAILHQYMFQYLTNVCSNIYFIHFFEQNIDIWLNISPIFCIEGGGPRDDHRHLWDDHQDHNSSPGKSLLSSLSILSSSKGRKETTPSFLQHLRLCHISLFKLECHLQKWGWNNSWLYHIIIIIFTFCRKAENSLKIR